MIGCLDCLSDTARGDQVKANGLQLCNVRNYELICPKKTSSFYICQLHLPQ